MVKKPIALYYRLLKYQPENYQRLQKEFDLCELDTPAQDNSTILEKVEVLFAPLGFMVDKRKIDSCPHLKVIASNTTGHPHIDVDYAVSKGMAVACLKFANDFLQTITPTAELTWGLILALTRRIIPAHLATIQGQWDRRQFGSPTMLSRMSLGVVGHGRLGRLVARYGKAFGMQVNYFDPYVHTSSEGASRSSSLEELVSISDIVSLHVPHEPENENMFNEKIFSCFKKNSYFINTSRGDLVNSSALFNALQSGILKGAATDVFENEFRPDFLNNFSKEPLLEYARTHENLIITPHIGGSTEDAWRLTESHTIDMILKAL